MVTLRELLEEMTRKKASDLHITAGTQPQLRVDGSVMPTAHPVLTPDDTARLAYSILTEDQKKRFESSKELDLSFGIQGVSRFRANAFLQRGVVSIAIRQIPYQVPTFEDLGVPPVVQEFTTKKQGLILVTGPAGSGKSTTLAAIIDKINSERHAHIITIEDPIEFVHHHKKCIVNQREVNSDTPSFASALKYVLRQDPDVILVGEMRDFETVSAALTIAETGHLVFATLHTNSTFESVNRIVDVFPSEQQEQVFSQLAFVLEGVVRQQLIPRMRGSGRVLVTEILVCTPAVRAVIREGKIHQIYSLMQAGQKYGMQTMNQALYKAYMSKQISLDDAIGRSSDVKELEQMMGKSVAFAA
ncbi:MAG: type IV pilus twitching motility protein PilT [Candidatus Eisenbacteria bacterium]|nr:type IV pilus twitching motility protein PilT [Candidatus Eisenbacteria bacterium]